MAYSLTSGSSITRDSDSASIPADLRNVDYQAFLALAYGQPALDALLAAFAGDPAATPLVPGTGNPVPDLSGLTYTNTPNPPPPAPPPTLTFLQFVALFTQAEQDAIVTSTDTQTKLFMLMATGAGSILLSNSEVIEGVNYLAAAAPNGPGLITSARAAAILAGLAPPL